MTQPKYTVSPTPANDGASRDDVEVCRDVVRAYHDVIDRGHATSAAKFLAPNAVIEMRGQSLQGDAITAFLEHRESLRERQTAHVLVNLPVLNASESSITLGGMLLIHTRNNVGTYDLERVLDVTHRLERSQDGWLIAERTAHPIHAPLEPSTAATL